MYGVLVIAGDTYSTVLRISTLSLRSSQLEFSVNEKNELLAGAIQAGQIE